MNYYETKKEDGYHYEVEDLFGKITITSDTKLDGQALDSITMAVLRIKRSSGTITTGVSFTYEAASDWMDDDTK